MPWVGFSGVVDPVRFAVLTSENDLGSAEVKLLDFHRYLLSCVSLLHCFIVIGLAVKHVNRPFSCNDSSNNNILHLPLISTLGSFHIKCIILDQVLILRQNHLKIGIKASNIQRPRSSTNEISASYGISNRLTIHFEDGMSQHNSSVVSCRIFSHIGYNWTRSHGFNHIGWHLLKQRVLDFTSSVEHDTKRTSADTSFVVFTIRWQSIRIQRKRSFTLIGSAILRISVGSQRCCCCCFSDI
mmetsp:Transcript_26254/g.39712  ORF Transcript_26254/g.39712 Transcript_26254/m.39712 type:complete len:241 (+) Transcript_26254:372-1094(+)